MTSHFERLINDQCVLRITQQEKAFIGWVNAHLQHRDMHITNLQKDISSVLPLVHLLEILENKSLKKITKNSKKSWNKFQKLDAMRICLKQIQSREHNDTNTVPFDEETLVSGKEIKPFLALIWRIIVNYGIKQVDDNSKNGNMDKKNKNDIESPEMVLRNWCNNRLSKELQISNFTQSWSNGKVWLYLANQALAKTHRIKSENINNMNNKEVLDNVLKLNDEHLHIPQLLDTNDLINAPNKEAVMTYVSLLRSVIEAKDAEIEDLKDEMEQADDIKDNAPDMNPNTDEEIEIYINEDQDVGVKHVTGAIATCGNIDNNVGDNAPDIDDINTDINIDLNEYEDEMEDTSDNNVDLCILCDVTQGMDPWFDEIKKGIRRIVQELKSTFGIGILRLSFIGYRDWNDYNNNLGHERIETLAFTKKILIFERFVENIKAVGGGDSAEDVLGGIQETLCLVWKAPIRVLYHICDAPGHGTMYHDYFDRLDKEQQQEYMHDNMCFLGGISGDDTDSESDDDELLLMEGNDDDDDDDDVMCMDREREAKLLRDEWDKWPNKHPQDPDHEDLFRQLKDKNIQYYIGTQTHFTDKMVKVFKDYCESIDYKLNSMDLTNVWRFLPTLIGAVEDAVRIKRPPSNSNIRQFINLEELQKRKMDFKVHCGIDFGTAGSGFAYALPGKNEVYTDQNWPNSKHVDVKTKTNILLDPNGNCIAFGDDATDKYTYGDKCKNDLFFERFKMALYGKSVNDDENKDEKQSNNRVDTRGLVVNDTLTAVNGKQLPSRKVLEEAIRFMKDHAMNILRKNVDKNLKIEHVQWILTVPAIWSDRAKSVMKTAAINAGMVDPQIEGQLIIAYEPDCASLSILHEINEKARAIHKQKQTKLKTVPNEDEKVQQETLESYFQLGDKILLCDLGGGTADIACHEIDENERIRQIVAPSGGAWGSTYVDECFLELLGMVFSAEWMDEFKVSHPSTYIEFLSNFRVAKKTYKMKDKKKVKKKALDTTFHNVKVPFVFLDFMGEKAEEKADEMLWYKCDVLVHGYIRIFNQNKYECTVPVPVIELCKRHYYTGDKDDDDDDDDDDLAKIVKSFKRFNKKGLIKLDEEYLEISYTIWNILFDTVVDPIVAHCTKLLCLPEMNGCNYLLLVGGFSESKHLQSKIFSNFGKKSKYNILIFIPKRPILSVVDGAARMGLKPDFISARTVAKTYGIAIQKDLDEFTKIYPHSMSHKIIPQNRISKRRIYTSNNNKEVILNKQVVNGVFLPFVRKNVMIKNDDEPIIYWGEPADANANTISIKLYDSTEYDPIFVEDERELNKIEITLSDEFKKRNEAIPVIFIFNDTTIRVFVCIITDDGKQQNKEVTIDFDVVK